MSDQGQAIELFHAAKNPQTQDGKKIVALCQHIAEQEKLIERMRKALTVARDFYDFVESGQSKSPVPPQAVREEIVMALLAELDGRKDA